MTIFFSINQETLFAPAIEIPFACVFPITPLLYAYMLRRKFSDPGATISVVVYLAMSRANVIGLHVPIVVGCAVVCFEGRAKSCVEDITERRILFLLTDHIILIYCIAMVYSLTALG